MYKTLANLNLKSALKSLKLKNVRFSRDFKQFNILVYGYGYGNKYDISFWIFSVDHVMNNFELFQVAEVVT